MFVCLFFSVKTSTLIAVSLPVISSSCVVVLFMISFWFYDIVFSCIIKYIPFMNSVCVMVNFKNAVKIIHYFSF